jgi:hypothetical protein
MELKLHTQTCSNAGCGFPSNAGCGFPSISPLLWQRTKEVHINTKSQTGTLELVNTIFEIL